MSYYAGYRKSKTMALEVSDSKMYDHITPVLKDLHWLPIEEND